VANPALSCAIKFISHVKYVEPTRSKMEKSFDNGFVVKRDVEVLYTGLYLEAVCSFELFLEDLFIGLLTGKLYHPSRDVSPRVNFRSHLVARDIILGGKKYVDWLPWSLIETRAKAYFRDGRPFTSISANDKQLVDQVCRIRNALAHKSDYSLRKLEEGVSGSIPLLVSEKTPAGFLRSKFRIAPVQTRYENYIGELVILAVHLCT
jgi:hypothetical protein